jgi:hypothetical protein
MRDGPHRSSHQLIIIRHQTPKINTTFNNGSLGSRNDEGRSEMRNVMRFAAPVSHRVFERTWHRGYPRYTCLSIGTKKVDGC